MRLIRTSWSVRRGGVAGARYPLMTTAPTRTATVATPTITGVRITAARAFRRRRIGFAKRNQTKPAITGLQRPSGPVVRRPRRSEERRVGKECRAGRGGDEGDEEDGEGGGETGGGG